MSRLTPTRDRCRTQIHCGSEPARDGGQMAAMPLTIDHACAAALTTGRPGLRRGSRREPS
ncbi:hypothetical protein C1894_00690 [Pseudomonas sp. FW305-3-2-15-E-TSA2]|nr:hypothetical protein C1895_06975 [Pseudomonas sp. FW305-3-2-15-E-TSA4]POA45756.1 hypothetical protein C1894_00690 [Pseudomonas sp. FW305-3-2-15-E-TSA2]